MPEVTPGLADEDALEPFCTTCGVRASIFTDRSGRWLHYSGEPDDRTVHPYDPGHPPTIGWRPTPGIVVVAR